MATLSMLLADGILSSAKAAEDLAQPQPNQLTEPGKNLHTRFLHILRNEYTVSGDMQKT